MIRNLLLVSGSGLVLFTKEFVVSQKRMMGALLIAMRELSRKVGPLVCAGPFNRRALPGLCTALFLDISPAPFPKGHRPPGRIDRADQGHGQPRGGLYDKGVLRDLPRPGGRRSLWKVDGVAVSVCVFGSRDATPHGLDESYLYGRLGLLFVSGAVVGDDQGGRAGAFVVVVCCVARWIQHWSWTRRQRESLSFSLSLSLSLSLSRSLSLSPSVSLSLYLYLSISLFPYLSIYLSISIYLYLSTVSLSLVSPSSLSCSLYPNPSLDRAHRSPFSMA